MNSNMHKEKINSPSRDVWRRMKKNPLAMAGISIVSLSVFISIFAYVVMPDSTPMANEMSLPLSIKKPGFHVEMIWLRKNKLIEKPSWISEFFFGEESKFEKIPIQKYAFNGADLIYEEYAPGRKKSSPMHISLADAVYDISADAPEVLAKNDSLFFQDMQGLFHRESIASLRMQIQKNQIHQRTFLLGTDRFGRDLFSRLIAGTRVSLAVGLISVIISLFIGLGLGSIAGFYRGWVDNWVMWLINVVWSIPTLLLVIAITLALGKGFWQVFVAVGLTMWVDVARVVRGQIFSVRVMEYVEAGHALGFTNRRIIIRHILPNILGPVIVIAASNFASAILLEAGLSFLGMGAQPPMPSWGVMIKENYGYIVVDAAYLAVFPGIAIMLLVLAFTLLGNGLRDALDKKAVRR